MLRLLRCHSFVAFCSADDKEVAHLLAFCEAVQVPTCRCPNLGDTVIPSGTVWNCDEPIAPSWQFMARRLSLSASALDESPGGILSVKSNISGPEMT
jgi:hypothetical protein